LRDLPALTTRRSSDLEAPRLDAGRRARDVLAYAQADVAIGIAGIEGGEPEAHQQEPGEHQAAGRQHDRAPDDGALPGNPPAHEQDRKSTRLNSSHVKI